MNGTGVEYSFTGIATAYTADTGAMFSTTGQGVAKVTAGSVSLRSGSATWSLLFVRSLAHTDVSVEALASSVSSPFDVRRACSGALVAAPGFFLEPDSFQLESLGSCERAVQP